MNDKELKEFLSQGGYPEHIVKGGKRGLLARYGKFVAAVESGYSLTLDDYRNDLDLRTILHRAGLDSNKTVVELDRRLRQALQFSAQAIWECDENPQAFWIFGYPSKPKGDLKKDLAAGGYLRR